MPGCPLPDVPEDRPELRGFLEAIVEAGSDDTPRRILADWLEEHDEPQRAELLRLHLTLLATCCDPDAHPDRGEQQARLVELLAAGVRPCVPRRTVMLAEGAVLTFAWVPPGTFLMGSPPGEQQRSDNENLHRVTLSRGYYLGIHPVTQAQWSAVMGSNPSRVQGDDRPVERVSWDDCQELCARLGQRTGQRFRLPTEVEWERACRAGTTTSFFVGETISTDQANYIGNDVYGKGGLKGVYRKQTTPVDGFPANPWGLFDMHGNVWEWCHDWYGPYREGDVTDPQGGMSGKAHGLRGGSWVSDPNRCRSAYRDWSAPARRNDRLGCRVVLCLD
jgi:uncharacterized protein (TIGR02996 family)